MIKLDGKDIKFMSKVFSSLKLREILVLRESGSREATFQVLSDYGDVQIKIYLPVLEASAEDYRLEGEFFSKTFLSVLKSLPDDLTEIEIGSTQDSLEVAFPSGSFSIPSQPWKYPEPPEEFSEESCLPPLIFKIGAEDLHLALSTVHDFASQEECRDLVQNVLLSTKDDLLKITATDGTALGKVETFCRAKADRDLLIHREMASLLVIALSDSKGEVEVRADNAGIVVVTDKIQISGDLYTKKPYPDYTPKLTGGLASFTAPRKSFLEATDLVLSYMVSDYKAYNKVSLDITLDNVTLTSTLKDVKYQAQACIDNSGNIPSTIRQHFNGEYLRNILRKFAEDANLFIRCDYTNYSPLEISDNSGVTFYLMPMRA